MPLHTLRADIDYAHVGSHDPLRHLGIKVWIFKGEILEHDPMATDRRASEAQDRRRDRVAARAVNASRALRRS